MADFLQYLEDVESNEEKIINILRADADAIFDSYPAIKDSVFTRHPVAVKMLLQSRPNIFWNLWEYCEQKEIQDLDDSEVVQSLRENGVHVMPSFFSREEVDHLKNMWEFQFNRFPDLSNMPFGNSRFRKAKVEGKLYIEGGPFDGRKRIMNMRPFKDLPKEIKNLVVKNKFLNETVQNYFYLNERVVPTRVMMEHLTPTHFDRYDKSYHVDNLTDQFKVMIVLEDMTEKDGPFSFISGTHRVQEHQKERYHKMYAMLGIGTHAQNHFENSFADVERSQDVVAKAGDIVLFDCKLHHSGNFVQQGGDRKNMMLFYNLTPTLRNKILHRIDNNLHW